ncbi:MAG: EpsG family protein [Prevotella sp.]|nr:EpsG family protein [Prevotella sp.]
MIYTIPYILLISFFFFLGIFYETTENRKTRQNIAIATILVFFVFFGFRGFILSDWTSYYSYFYDCDISYITNYKIGSAKYWEPAYTALNILCRAIFPDWQFLVFTCSLINTTLLLLFFRKRINNIPLALMLFVSFEGLGIMTNLMRNSIAILLFMNSLRFIKERKPIPYYAICLIAFGFHSSSILYFPLYFFFHRKLNKWVYLGVFIVCNIVFITKISIFLSIAKLIGIDQIFASRVEAYTEFYSKSTVISIGYLERLLTGGLIFCYYEKLHSIRKENTIFINAMVAYFILFFFFSEFEVLSKRMATLFSFGYWIIWYDLIHCFSIDNNRRLFKGFIYIYCVLKMVGMCHYADYDYDNVLFGAKSYQERLYLYNKNFQEQ